MLWLAYFSGCRGAADKKDENSSNTMSDKRIKNKTFTIFRLILFLFEFIWDLPIHSWRIAEAILVVLNLKAGYILADIPAINATASGFKKYSGLSK